MARALADAAIGNGVDAVVETLVGVQRGELVVRFEGAILIRGGRPRDVDRAGHVAALLRLLLGKVGGRRDLAAELVRATDVDQVLDADGRDDLVAERANAGVGGLRDIGGCRARDGISAQRTAIELPLLATAVDQLHILVAVDLEVPVGVGREPVVVSAVQDDGVVVGDAALGEELSELLGVEEVAARRILQVLPPVELHGAGDVPAVIGGGVFVDLDEDDPLGVEVLLSPIGADQDIVACHGGSLSHGWKSMGEWNGRFRGDDGRVDQAREGASGSTRGLEKNPLPPSSGGGAWATTG